MKYNSKKDWWIGIIIWIPMLLGLYSTWHATFIENQSFVIFTVFVILIGFVSWIWFGTYYVFNEENLIIRCGPFIEIIPYEKIIHVKKTRNPLSSAALSLDRIEIKYGKMTMISPVNNEDFLDELRKKCRYAFIE